MIHKNNFKKRAPHNPGGCQCIAPQARCSNIFFQKLSHTTSVFYQKTPFFWSKTPKPSKVFFSKIVPHTRGSCQCIAPPVRCSKKFFKNCPTQPTFVVQVVFKLFQLFDQFCDICMRFFSKIVPHTRGSCQCIAPPVRCTSMSLIPLSHLSQPSHQPQPSQPSHVVQATHIFLNYYGFYLPLQKN